MPTPGAEERLKPLQELGQAGQAIWPPEGEAGGDANYLQVGSSGSGAKNRAESCTVEEKSSSNHQT